MSKVDEIVALRKELEDKRAARNTAEAETVAAIRDAEQDREIERLKLQLAEEDAAAELLVGAGQNPAAVPSFGVERTPEEILAASAAAVAVAEGREPETEGTVGSVPAASTTPEPEKTPKANTAPTTASTASSAAAKTEEK